MRKMRSGGCLKLGERACSRDHRACVASKLAPTAFLGRSADRGFALIITLSLLALLVLALLSLSVMVRISGQVSASGTYQTQARQNAMLGLNIGLSDLQRYAGDDTRITGMAGITGIAANAANSRRHWCGVWRNDGTFVAWLASGAQASALAALQNGTTGIELVASGSAGAAAANSEHGIAAKIPIVVAEVPGAPGTATTLGHYAYLVSDEGVKISAYAPAAQLSITNVKPLITSTTATSAQGKLRTAVDTYLGKLPAVISYEQLALLPTPAAALTPSILQDNFHHVTMTSRTVAGSQYYAGMVNLNTASTILWRSLLETYNSVSGVTQIPTANLTTKGNAIGNGLAASTAGKSLNGPFTSVATFSNYLAVHFPLTGSPTHVQIMNALSPMLTVRSDTFRIRGYGEALNPVDATRIEASAQCEVIVQRTTDPAPNGLGRKFVVLYFRWLGPTDL